MCIRDRLYNVRPNGKEDAPQLQLHIDFAKAASLGVSVASINDTLSTAWGSSYVNDFYDRGRIKQVYVQGDEKFRQRPEDLDRWYVRNDKGEMVPFSAFCSTEWKFGSSRLERFNGLGAVNIQGAPAAGFTTGQAMLAMEEIAKALPYGFGIAWNGISFQEQQAGSQTGALYTLSILIVFLCLAALYESWSIPIAVILVAVSYTHLPYIFGTVCAYGLSEIRHRMPEVFPKIYSDFLFNSGRMSVDDLFKKFFKIDITQPEFWESGLKAMERKISVFEAEARKYSEKAVMENT